MEEAEAIARPSSGVAREYFAGTVHRGPQRNMPVSFCEAECIRDADQPTHRTRYPGLLLAMGKERIRHRALQNIAQCQRRWDLAASLLLLNCYKLQTSATASTRLCHCVYGCGRGSLSGPMTRRLYTETSVDARSSTLPKPLSVAPMQCPFSLAFMSIRPDPHNVPLPSERRRSRGRTRWQKPTIVGRVILRTFGQKPPHLHSALLRIIQLQWLFSDAANQHPKDNDHV